MACKSIPKNKDNNSIMIQFDTTQRKDMHQKVLNLREARNDIRWIIALMIAGCLSQVVFMKLCYMFGQYLFVGIFHCVGYFYLGRAYAACKRRLIKAQDIYADTFSLGKLG